MARKAPPIAAAAMKKSTALRMRSETRSQAKSQMRGPAMSATPARSSLVSMA